jgi:hypothetical protein
MYYDQQVSIEYDVGSWDCDICVTQRWACAVLLVYGATQMRHARRIKQERFEAEVGKNTSTRIYLPAGD